MNYKLIPIGQFEATPNDAFIEIFPEYRKAMEGLEEFSYLQIIWWFDKCDNDESRSKLMEEKPYKKGSYGFCCNQNIKKLSEQRLRNRKLIRNDKILL